MYDVSETYGRYRSAGLIFSTSNMLPICSSLGPLSLETQRKCSKNLDRVLACFFEIVTYVTRFREGASASDYLISGNCKIFPVQLTVFHIA